jgi:integrase
MSKFLRRVPFALLLWMLLHGLRAREVEALNGDDFDRKRVNIRKAKD